MRRLRSRAIVTLALGAVVLYAILAVAELFRDAETHTDSYLLAVDLLLLLWVPFVVLALARLRPVLHWISFGAIAIVTGVSFAVLTASESSTAGFGLLFVESLLIAGVLVAAACDRLIASPRRSREAARGGS
jgi:hypothetical protein